VRSFFRSLNAILAKMDAASRAAVGESIRATIGGIGGFTDTVKGLRWKDWALLISDLTLDMNLGKKGPEVLAKAKKVASECGEYAGELLRGI